MAEKEENYQKEIEEIEKSKILLAKQFDKQLNRKESRYHLHHCPTCLNRNPPIKLHWNLFWLAPLLLLSLTMILLSPIIYKNFKILLKEQSKESSKKKEYVINFFSKIKYLLLFFASLFFIGLSILLGRCVYWNYVQYKLDLHDRKKSLDNEKMIIRDQEEIISFLLQKNILSYQKKKLKQDLREEQKKQDQ